jgi:hypothetical protein
MEALSNSSKLAAQAAAVITSVAVASEAMVQTFAHGMEKLFYASKQTRSSVENLQAMDYAFRQIGLSGEDASQTVEALAKGLRLNPGMEAFLNNLGVKTTNRDRVQVLFDTVEQLGKMPHFIGARWAEQLGIPEETFLRMTQFLPDLRKAYAERLKMQRESGVNADQAAKVSREYMNMLRQLWERVTLLGNVLAVKLLPYFKEFTLWMNRALQSTQKWLQAFSGVDIELGVFVKDMVKDFTEITKSLDEIWTKHGDQIMWFFMIIKTGAINATKALVGALDALLMLAAGHPQAALDRLKQAAADLLVDQGGSDLLGKGKGGGGAVIPLAQLQRFDRETEANTGPGYEWRKWFGGNNSKPTSGLGTGILTNKNGFVINQQTDIRVEGSGSPEATGRAVGREQNRVNSDIVRNLAGAVQ